jgi:hypothetical protein
VRTRERNREPLQRHSQTDRERCNDSSREINKRETGRKGGRERQPEKQEKEIETDRTERVQERQIGEKKEKK